MDKSKFKELWEEDELEEVFSEADPSWRHGCYMYEVFKADDGRFWAVSFQLSGDGEYHGIREGDFDLSEVEPYEVTTIKYRHKSTDG